MTLDRLRRIGIVLFVLCALPAIVPIFTHPAGGRVMGWILDAVTLLLGFVLIVSFVHMIGSAFWRGIWHT